MRLLLQTSFQAPRHIHVLRQLQHPRSFTTTTPTVLSSSSSSFGSSSPPPPPPPTSNNDDDSFSPSQPTTNPENDKAAPNQAPQRVVHGAELNEKTLKKANPTFDGIRKGQPPEAKLALLNTFLKANWALAPHSSASGPRCSLTQTFRFKKFEQAMFFVNQVAGAASKHNHHPEWSNIYNAVFVRWTTHSDDSGLTHMDFKLAWETEAIAKAIWHSTGGNPADQEGVREKRAKKLKDLADEVLKKTGAKEAGA